MRSYIILLIFCLNFPAFCLNAQEIVSLETRPGVIQKILLIKPSNPIASVILFPGGSGIIKLRTKPGSSKIKYSSNNFLVRSKNLFAEQGFQVAVVDAPSDKNKYDGMLYGFRTSKDHVKDIDRIILYLRQQADVPVWLIGTSRGTESTAHIAIHSKQHPDGLILTSSMSVSNHKGKDVTQMGLNKITIPTLVLAHIDDECHVTPPHGAQQIAKRLTNATPVKVKLFNGGDFAQEDPCKALSPHGFIGIEKEVVKYISEFIRAHTPSP